MVPFFLQLAASGSYSVFVRDALRVRLPLFFALPCVETARIRHGSRLSPAPTSGASSRLPVARFQGECPLAAATHRGATAAPYYYCNLVFALFFADQKRKMKYPKGHPTSAPPRSPSLIVPPTKSYLPKIRIVRPMFFQRVFFLFCFHNLSKGGRRQNVFFSWNYT